MSTTTSQDARPGLARAMAHSNIALVKYWGKRDAALNLPAAGSLSMTLGGLLTDTTVRFDDDLSHDALWLNGQPQPTAKLTAFLDLVRRRAGVQARAHVTSHNTFPTAAGLASSASGWAALATAACAAAGLDLSPQERSVLARQGSGSAARSIFGGFVEMLPGQRPDGSDAFAVEVADVDHWPLRCLVALCAQGPKEHGSTDAMTHTAMTSPYYDAWIQDVPRALERARRALLARDLEPLAAVSEESCLRMHASAMAAAPGVLYWRGVTVEIIHAVRRWRALGEPCFFTIDAGPHVKVFCLDHAAPSLEAKLRQIEGVLDVLVAPPGRGAWLHEP